MSRTARWEQRFQNFDRAVRLLREPIARGIDTLSPLEKEGTAQRFEMTVELGWKTAKDYLQGEGVAISPVTPRMVVKEAYAAGMIADGQIWIDMLDHRNLLSHTYDEEVLDETLEAIESTYMSAINDLHQWLTQHLP